MLGAGFGGGILAISLPIPRWIFASNGAHPDLRHEYAKA